MLLVFNPNRSKLRARPYQPSMKNRDAYCVTSEVGDKAERMEFSMTDLKLGIFKKKSENTQGQTDLRSKKPEVRVLLSEQTFTTFRFAAAGLRLSCSVTAWNRWARLLEASHTGFTEGNGDFSCQKRQFIWCSMFWACHLFLSPFLPLIAQTVEASQDTISQSIGAARLLELSDQSGAE
ncbi:hypothetical protein RRG08_018787 [Elysia crispata]|uniref:Uncharacterized protein n=1 Tax=Elysia crispata TaxID=231223 RepID=A0AAE1B7Z2_9GAST|nr:hypothetical protein RRG08_018787 [Elysia crispata]